MMSAAGNRWNRSIGAAFFLCALIVVLPGKASAGPGDPLGVDVVEDAIRDMQWHEKMHRPRTPAPQGAIPAPPLQPAIQKPDLSGLPLQLPQALPAKPEIRHVPPPPPVARPNPDDTSTAKQPLIKPRIGYSNPPERASTRQETKLPPQKPAAPLKRPHIPPEARTGLIKPRVGAAASQKPRTAPRASTREEKSEEEQPRPAYAPPPYQPPPLQNPQAAQVPQPNFVPQVPVQQPQHGPLVKPQPRPQQSYPSLDAEQSRRIWRMMGAWD